MPAQWSSLPFQGGCQRLPANAGGVVRKLVPRQAWLFRPPQSSPRIRCDNALDSSFAVMSTMGITRS
jgi:hypothetical protein